MDEYINQPKFKKDPLTAEELQTIGNYILWGKDPSTHLNAVQAKDIEIESHYKTWTKEEPESLDAIIESSSFEDIMIKKISDIPQKKPRVIFSRKNALENCPPTMRETFEELFKQIDKTDLAIGLYEWEHGKRKAPPRPELVEKFSEEEIEQTKQQISHWNQRTYLKKRHYLVDLRRQQFAFRDIYTSHVDRHSLPLGEDIYEAAKVDIDSEIKVFPLGCLRKANRAADVSPTVCGEDGLSVNLSQLLFRNFGDLLPQNYSEEELRAISKFIWEKEAQAKEKKPSLFIDFKELEHVYWLFNYYFDLKDYCARPNFFGSTSELLDTLFYYVEQAELDDVHKDILEMKIKKERNQDIARYVNKKHGKTYTTNYISTIFRHKIIPKINAAADYHEKIVKNLFFEEEFKKCNKCGRLLLKDTRNFGRKSRAKDGFSSKCKICDKEERQNRK